MVPTETPRIDSIVFGEGCSEYTCYFTAGTIDRKALGHIRTVVFDTPLCDADFGNCPDYDQAERYRRQILDSLSSLEWLDCESWISLRNLFLAWSEQQLDRSYIVYRAESDPAYLYDCSETDSILVRCGDILIEGGDRYVDRVRSLWKEIVFSNAAADSVRFDRSYLDWTLAHIEECLSDSDSTCNARERLFQLLSNHINGKIHRRLGKDGTVDFSAYGDDFFHIFDSVRVETYEP